jgi:LPS-assembly protein
MRKPNHPFFGDFRGLQYARQYDPISDSDIGNPNTGVQFDYNDRTFERRVVTYSLDNRITRKLFNDGMVDYQTLTLFRISQSYDFNEAQREKSHPWSSIDALLDMRFEHFETYTTASYNPYAHKTNTSARVRGMVTPKNFVQVGFTQNFILDSTDFSAIPNGETRSYGVGGGFVTKYLELEGQIDFSDITHQVQSWSYGMNIRPPGRCWIIRFDHIQVPGGDPHFHASLNFDFGGETKSETAVADQAIIR